MLPLLLPQSYPCPPSPSFPSRPARSDKQAHTHTHTRPPPFVRSWGLYLVRRASRLPAHAISFRPTRLLIRSCAMEHKEIITDKPLVFAKACWPCSGPEPLLRGRSAASFNKVRSKQRCLDSLLHAGREKRRKREGGKKEKKEVVGV